MLNWNTDEKRFKKEDPEGYKLWRLTQLINYGLDGEKLKASEIKKAWPKIEENIDPYIKRYLEYMIWGKLYSLPANLTFWDINKMYYEKRLMLFKKETKRLGGSIIYKFSLLGAAPSEAISRIFGT